MFIVDGRMIGVYCVAGEYFALDNECPHAGASLAHGLVREDEVACRIHHWRFCIKDGRYLDGDNPAYNVASHQVRVQDGQIQVLLKQAL